MYNQENLHPLEDKLKTEKEAKFLACVIQLNYVLSLHFIFFICAFQSGQSIWQHFRTVQFFFLVRNYLFAWNPQFSVQLVIYTRIFQFFCNNFGFQKCPGTDISVNLMDVINLVTESQHSWVWKEPLVGLCGSTSPLQNKLPRSWKLFSLSFQTWKKWNFKYAKNHMKLQKTALFSHVHLGAEGGLLAHPKFFPTCWPHSQHQQQCWCQPALVSCA